MCKSSQGFYGSNDGPDCTALAKPADAPAALPVDFIDTEHSGTNREMLAEFYTATFCEGGTADEITLRGINAVLARWGQPPASPAEGEVAEMVAWLKENAEYSDCQADPEDAVMFRRAAELLERHAAPVPVAVAERLPGPEDCDAEGRCWLHGKVEGDWRLINPAKSGVPHLRYCFSHWLPAHVLPLPAQGGEVKR